MKTYHILNGDCLAYQLKATNINKDFIICREALIDGDVLAENLNAFWNLRANFMANAYSVSKKDYYDNTVSEFEKLFQIPNYAEVYLWFENDLFCQVNMWFVISLLGKNSTLKLYRVFPINQNNIETWHGFANETKEKLELSFELKIAFTKQEIELGENLWNAYKNKDFKILKELALNKSACFKHLKEVCQAHLVRFPVNGKLGKPEQKIKEIMESGITEFQDVFNEFNISQGIFGFGDLQLKTIYNKLLKMED